MELQLRDNEDRFVAGGFVPYPQSPQCIPSRQGACESEDVGSDADVDCTASRARSPAKTKKEKRKKTKPQVALVPHGDVLDVKRGRTEVHST